MTEQGAPASGSKLAFVAFLGGALMAAVIAIAFFVFVAYRVGFMTIWERTGVPIIGMVLDMPQELIDEVAALNGAIGNAGNPTGADEHDTILVRPDAELGWVLRPDVAVDGHQIVGGDPLNLDPPVIYLPVGAPRSPALREYLDERTMVKTRITTDSDANRRTLPAVAAERRILMVGDSGVFGVGVDDEHTIASNLQRLVGDCRRIVNAGVAGYDGRQVLKAATRMSHEDDFDLLIYIAHNNDFYERRHMSNPDKLRNVIEGLGEIADRFEHGVVVALLMSLEYTAQDMLRWEGWNPRRIAALDRLRSDLVALNAARGFPFVDWTDIAAEVQADEKSLFAVWSLYVDHAHLAPRATQLFAERIFARLPGEICAPAAATP
jgi:hypothetical protein